LILGANLVRHLTWSGTLTKVDFRTASEPDRVDFQRRNEPDRGTNLRDYGIITA
jgi:hypothetical protein